MKWTKEQKHYTTAEERVVQYIRPVKKGAKTARPSLPSPSPEAIGFIQGERRYFNPNNCISYLLRVCNIQLFDEGKLRIYNYQQGIWEELSEAMFGTLFATLVNHSLPGAWRKRYEDDVYAGLKRTAFMRRSLQVPEHLIAVQNGVFDLKEQKLKPHSGRYGFQSKSPIPYREGAACPRFLQALDEIFRGDAQLIQVLQEVFGNCLLDSAKAEKAIFWYGAGANGKSVMADILTLLVGKEQVSHVSLSSFSAPFGLQSIVNKKVNLSAENELGAAALETELLKGIISGDRINIARKYKEDLSIQPTTTLIFLVNTLPQVADTSHGFYRKMLILPFPRVFQQGEMDKYLRDKLRKELEGILCWALEGATRLYQNQFLFSEADQIQKALKSYKLEQNPVPQFLKERLEYLPEYKECAKQKKLPPIRIDKREVLSAYEKWLRQQDLSGHGTESPYKFWKLLGQAAAVAGHPIPLDCRKSSKREYLYGYQFRNHHGSNRTKDSTG